MIGKDSDMSDKIAFDHLLENTTDGFFVIGYDGRIRMENALAADILDLGDKPLYGKTLVELISESKNNDEFFECIINAVFKKEKLGMIVPFYKNGNTANLRLVVSPLRDRKDDIAAIVMFSDITEVSELGIKNEILTRKLADFIDRFVKVMIGAIDERTPYNANHTRNMVSYAEKYLTYLDTQGRGVESEKKGPLFSSIWMHDVGKLIIPLEVMDKPTRLGDKEKEIRHKVEVAILGEKLRIAESKIGVASLIDEAISSPGTEITIKSDDMTDGFAGIGENKVQAEERIAHLEEALSFILDVNNRGYVDDETREKIMGYADIPCLTFDGQTVPLLDDYDREALTVERGTLTNSERKLMQSHVSKTYEMLKEMNFEGPYKDVPDWAGKHHELLDGSGYPNKVNGEVITWETRLLTILDIYDALTAEDRPYKPPLSAEKAFEILRDMANNGKIDLNVLEDFIKSEAWK